MVKKTNVEEKKHMFNDKRAQSIGITIAKMPPVTKISEALQKMDGAIMNRNSISALLREFITDEELNELISLDEPGTIWDKQETFMLAISKVEFAKIKLNIWNFTFDFVENYENVKIPINMLGEVIYVNYRPAMNLKIIKPLS